MDVDPYRLAYNVFHCNWKRFGIPEEDIPPPKSEKVASLDLIIPGLSITVALFQISSRNDLKYFLDTEYQEVHNLDDVYTRFENVMQVILPQDAIVADTPNETVNEDLSLDSAKESQDTLETYLSDDSMEADLLEDKEIFPNDAVNEGLFEDTMAGSLSENDMEEDLSENTLRSEDIPSIIVYSLAVGTELVLYDIHNGKNKEFCMKHMPDIWEKYFNEHLKPLCKKARFTQDHLKAYSNNNRCPERFLNKFLNENKEEYDDDIASKFFIYTTENFAVESPEHGQVLTKVRNSSKGLSFPKIIQKFKAAKEICKCATGTDMEEIPLLEDYSPCSSSSTSTTPSN